MNYVYVFEHLLVTLEQGRLGLRNGVLLDRVHQLRGLAEQPAGAGDVHARLLITTIQTIILTTIISILILMSNNDDNRNTHDNNI